MIDVRVYRDNDKNVVKYIVSGHARYSKVPKPIEYIFRVFTTKNNAGYPEMGRDVICAAASSVAQSAIVGLKDVINIKLGIEVEDGYLECIIPENISKKDRENANIILETMVLSLKNLEVQFGKFINVVETEV